MNESVEEPILTPEGRLEAYGHWDALMFAPSRTALESARVALSQASLSVQLAVMSDINEKWLQEYEPRREENPFQDSLLTPTVLPHLSVGKPLFLAPSEAVHFDIPRQQTSPALSTRLTRWFKTSLTPQSALPINSPLQKATLHR